MISRAFRLPGLGFFAPERNREMPRGGRSRIQRMLIPALAVALCAFLGANANAAQAEPILKLDIDHSPTNFPHDSGFLSFNVANVGDTATTGPLTLTIELPPGQLARASVITDSITVRGQNVAWSCPGSPGQTTITCTTSDVLARHAVNTTLIVNAGVFPAASGDPVTTATISGGGAAAAPPAAGCPNGVASCATEATHVSDVPADFGIVPDSWRADFYQADAVTPVRAAGSHPYQATFSFDLNSVDAPRDDQPLQKAPADNLRNIRVDLPPGFLGDPNAVGECTPVQLIAIRCPLASQVGRADVVLYPVADFLQDAYSIPVFNMSHPLGTINDLALSVSGIPVHIRASLDPSRNYAIKTTVQDLNESLPAFSSDVTIWGVPADPTHDSERCNGLVLRTTFECSSDGPQKPFLTVPFDCGASNQMRLSRYDSWQNSGVFGPDVVYELPGQFTDCATSQAEFDPDVSITPTATKADSPTGLNVEATAPYNDDPDGIVAPPVKRLEVKLPEGMAVNPAFADGLRGCTEAEIGISHAGVPDEEPVSCPDASRIGAVEISTPLLPTPTDFPPNCPGTQPLQGSIYLAKQQANPVNELFAIYTIFHDCDDRGVRLKLAGLDEARPQHGPDHDDLRQPAPVPVRRALGSVSLRRPRAADQPADLWDPHDRGHAQHLD